MLVDVLRCSQVCGGPLSERKADAGLAPAASCPGSAESGFPTALGSARWSRRGHVMRSVPLPWAQPPEPRFYFKLGQRSLVLIIHLPELPVTPS